jgi:hypothetical protein
MPWPNVAMGSSQGTLLKMAVSGVVEAVIAITRYQQSPSNRSMSDQPGEDNVVVETTSANIYSGNCLLDRQAGTESISTTKMPKAHMGLSRI